MSENVKSGNIRKVRVFVGLTFFFNYLMAFLFYRLAGNFTNSALFLGVPYMFVPAIVAISLQKFFYREPVKDLGVSWKINRWFLAAWLLPFIVAFATLGVSLLMPGAEYAAGMEGMFDRFRAIMSPEQLEQMREQIETLPVHPIWITAVQALFFGATVNAVAAFGEELGWRGFLQKELGFLGFWKSSTIIGLIWGIWHAPLILQGHNYPQHPVAGVFMMIAWTLLLAPIISYVRLRAKSVLAAAVLHGTLNASYGISIMVIKGGSDLTVGMTGIAGFIVLAAVNLGILLLGRVRETAESVS